MSPDEKLIIRTAAYEAVALGDAEIVEGEDGEVDFKLTDVGRVRAGQIIDAAIANHGLGAGYALAEAMGVDEDVGEALVTMRLKATAAQPD